YPYNVKLTDFWADKGMLDDQNDEEVDVELVLTMDDVKSDYDEGSIAKSFDGEGDAESSVFPTA
ncbi:MAG: hypothetical protein CL885_00115, partial [Dehalococcoidia bacterium]|nr:hypothetical protein [Dehalococcoidia bacterium]